MIAPLQEKAQIRLFVALLPPVAIQVYADTIIQSLRQRYHTHTSKAPPHITLQPPFLGSQAMITQVESQLEQFAQHQPIVPVQLSGFGAFAPRVLYINVVRTPALLQLQAALAETLEVEFNIKEPKTQRPFIPHLTVASRKLTRQTFRQAWAELKPRSVEFQFVAEQLTLLVHRGENWQVQAQFPLAGQWI